MTIEESERQQLLGALDSLALALVQHDHEWTEGERAIYENATRILGVPTAPPES